MTRRRYIKQELGLKPSDLWIMPNGASYKAVLSFIVPVRYYLLGFAMACVKRDDSTITWDSEGMAAAPPVRFAHVS